MRWLTRLTSYVVIAMVIGGVVLLIRAKMPSTRVAGSFKTSAKFRDGSKLAVGSPVVIAGVQVGVIEKLIVEGQFARVDMRLRDGLDLPVDSFATRRADSLFGDSYVEIIPETAEGASSARRLRSGDPIAHVVEGRSADTILRGIGEALPRIDNAMNVVHDVVISGRSWVNGPMNDQMHSTAEWLGEGHIEAPIEAAGHAVTRIDDLTTRGAAALGGSAPEVLRTLDRFDRAIAAARGRMRSARDGLVQAMRDTREGLDGVDPQIEQATELMAAIDRGSGDDWKGTLGRLVNDPALGNDLDEITEAGRDAAAGLSPFKSWLGMRVEYNVFSKDVRFYATGELRARGDKFYLAEFERGPLGGLPHDQLSDVAGSDAYFRQQEIHDRMRFTAQFGKQFGAFRVRGGIKDSTFGVGADALMLEGRLKLSADLYGAFQVTPRLKVAGALAVFRTLYVLAGVDDVLNPPGYLSVVSGNPGAPTAFEKVRHGRDYFVGTMLAFTDEDIAVLLRLYGVLLVGLL